MQFNLQPNSLKITCEQPVGQYITSI